MYKLSAVERCCYRRMLRVSCVDRVTNLKVLRRLDKEEKIVMTIKKKKLEHFGSVMTGPKYELLKIIIWKTNRRRKKDIVAEEFYRLVRIEFQPNDTSGGQQNKNSSDNLQPPIGHGTRRKRRR